MSKSKKIILLGIFLLQVTLIFSQEGKNNLFLEIRYPTTFGDINKGFEGNNKYTGLIDLGLDYNFIELGKLDLGINLNTSFLQLSESSTYLTILSPKIKAEYKLFLENGMIFIPQFGIGYTNWRLSDSELLTGQIGEPDQNEKFKQNENGIVLKMCTQLVFNSNKKVNWYLQLAYERTKLKDADDLSNTYIFEGNMQILYPGFGIIWNFKNTSE